MKTITSLAAVFLCIGIAKSQTPGLIYTTHADGLRLGTVVPSTGAATDVGPFNASQTWAAAFDTDGTLYTLINGFRGNARLAKVNPTSGALTLIGPGVGTNMICLEVAADGTMYGIGYNNGVLYKIDKTLGTATAIGATGISFAMDLAFDTAGVLWATIGNRFWTVNTTTGASTVRFNATGVRPFTSIMGIMFDAADNLLATNYAPGAELYRVSTTTGVATVVGPTGLFRPHGGDIYYPTNRPPIVDCKTPLSLWPPNHKFVDASQTFDVRDPDGDQVQVSISVWSDEPETPTRGDGSGRTAPDFKDERAGSGRGLIVRAERRGTADGRIVVFVVTADDGKGGVTRVACLAATIPHSSSAASHASVAAQGAAATMAIQAALDNNRDIASLGLFQHGTASQLGPIQ